MVPAARASLLLLAAVLLGCDGAARPQLLVVLDTDLPLAGQVLQDPRLSPDATVDTLRIDIIAEDGVTTEHLTAAAPDIRDWPLSFGVAAAPGQTVVRLRARLFRSVWSTTASLAGESVLEPFPELAITRALEIPVPDDSVEQVRAVLRGDCMGVPPIFSTPFRTCLASGQEAELATDGIETIDGEPPPSEAGTWPPAFERGCKDPSPDGALCIAGGFSVLGEPGLTNVSDGVLYQHDPAPARPVRNRPFHLDVREYTVARFRAAMAAAPGLLTADELPTVRDPGSDYLKYCTFLGLGNDSNDALPLNCLTFAASVKLCQADGGDLPSEAQWEHAARGRGQRRRYAWGNAPATCCDATLEVLQQGGCPGNGPGAASGGPDCGGHHDETRDGILDMTGNLYERTRDSSEPYTAPCWAHQGVLEDPVCQSDAVAAHVNRGGSWTVGLEHGMLALRSTGLDSGSLRDVGFRCAYPDGAAP